MHAPANQRAVVSRDSTPSHVDSPSGGHTSDVMSTTGDAVRTAQTAQYVSQLRDTAIRAEQDSQLDDIAWRRKHSAGTRRGRRPRTESTSHHIADRNGDPLAVFAQYIRAAGTTRWKWRFADGSRFQTVALGNQHERTPNVDEFDAAAALSLN